jgi:hypothetical protein
MIKSIFSISAIVLTVMLFADCKKPKEPVVVEEELITTLKVTVTDSNNIAQSFVYKVQNGFGSATQGTVQVDTIKLQDGYTYGYTVQVLNESVTPVEDVTEEVLAEKDAHLFLIVSDPQSGAGSISLSDGSKDAQNLPFNQSGKFTTGASGSGKLTIALLHEPTNKNGATTAETGGETDAEAIFPVLIQ